jgi:hypothetical protein
MFIQMHAEPSGLRRRRIRIPVTGIAVPKVLTIVPEQTSADRAVSSRIYYAEVAKYNRMAGFRELMPGEQSLFPLLGDSAQ